MIYRDKINNEVSDYFEGFKLLPGEFDEVQERVYDYCWEHGFTTIDQIDTDTFIDLVA